MQNSAPGPFPAACLPRTLRLFLPLSLCSRVDLHLHSHSQCFLLHDLDHVVAGCTSSHGKEKALRLVALRRNKFILWSRDTLKHTFSCLEQTQNSLENVFSLIFPLQ